MYIVFSSGKELEFKMIFDRFEMVWNQQDEVQSLEPLRNGGRYKPVTVYVHNTSGKVMIMKMMKNLSISWAWIKSIAAANKDRCNTDVLAGVLSKEKEGN